MKQLKSILKPAILLRVMLVAPIPVAGQDIKPGAAGDPYENMPLIAPLGERIGKHIEVNKSAKGKLAGFDGYNWDQCYAIEQSLRIEEQ